MKVIAIILMFVLCPWPVWADEAPDVMEIVKMKRGESAPSDGTLFTPSGVQKLVEKLRDAKLNEAKVETLNAQIAALNRQIAALQEQLLARKDADVNQAAELMLWKDRESRREADEKRWKTQLEAAQTDMQDARARIKQLENRELWLMFLGPLGLLLGGLGAAAVLK